MTKTTKTVSKKAAVKTVATKKPAPNARRKVTTQIAKSIIKTSASIEKKLGRTNIAAVARDFELSTVTINNVLNNKYGYL